MKVRLSVRWGALADCYGVPLALAVTITTADKLSKKLDAYIRYRAGKEGVEYELSPQYFREA